MLKGTIPVREVFLLHKIYILLDFAFIHSVYREYLLDAVVHLVT